MNRLSAKPTGTETSPSTPAREPQLITRSLSVIIAAAATSTALIGITATGAAAATGAANAASGQDKAFIVSNAQSNLAEIALGTLGEGRAQNSQIKELAEVTLSDHQKLQAQLTTVAAAAGVALPAAPNAMQQATAKQLTATSSAAFDLAYAQAEVLGHQLAISAANTEISAGTDAATVSYAKGYVPIATMHLNMATADVSALAGSAPTSVSAGTGGHATTDQAASSLWWIGVGGGLAIAIAAAGGVTATRRKSELA